MKNLLKRSVLKRSPFDLLKNVDQKIKSGMLKERPAWYNAMKLVPMAPMPSPYEDTSKSGAFGAVDSSIHEAQLYFSKNQSRRIQRRKNVSVMPIKMCREIEYPEDRIRAQFYKAHPFELNRPRLLIDDDHSLLNRDWSSIFGGNIPAPVTGESVVQYTLYLMSAKGGSLSENDAYEAALTEFYKARKDQELKEKEEFKLRATATKSKKPSLVQGAIESLETLESIKLKPKSDSILELEQIEIKDGQEYANMQFEALEVKRAAFKKLAAFEHQQTVAKG